MIDENKNRRYVNLPSCMLKEISKDTFALQADDGNHFTQYGIYEGMFLFFDPKKQFKKGQLSCYENIKVGAIPRFKLSDDLLEGYRHCGRLVMTIRNYEV